MNETPRITSTFKTNQDVDRLPVERSWLYRPDGEWTYSHHASLVHFNHAFHAIWSNGHENEDDTGQRVLMAHSPDGLQWTEPAPLLDTRRGKHSDLVLTAAGFHVHDGTLVAYVGAYEYRPAGLVDGKRAPSDAHHQDTTLLAVTSRDGATFTEPVDLGVPLVPNHGPQATRSGRLIISGNYLHPYTDDPAGLSGWTRSTIWPPETVAGMPDDSAAFGSAADAAGSPAWLCEGSWFQTDDGVIHMLQRSRTPRLWLSESSDDGASWSYPVETDFPDNVTKFHFGRLPDGRFYYVGCPDTEPVYARARLVLSTSADGACFDRHCLIADRSTPYTQRRKGMHKGGDYGYPHTMLHDGHLYVIVSRCKEAVEVMRIPLDALGES